MDGWWPAEDHLEILQGSGSHVFRGEHPTETILQELWAVEGPLHGELLVEQHAHEEGEPV